MKPKMQLDSKKDGDGYSMTVRAASILAAHGLKEEAKEIHQRAKIEEYDVYFVYRLLKEYVNI